MSASSDPKQTGLSPPKSPRPPTVSGISDQVVEQYLPASHDQSRRQKASTDVIAKSGNATILHQDDLKLAEQVATYGTTKDRGDVLLPSGEAFEEPQAFKFNSNGLTTAEAERRLALHGRNDLPEKVDPMWKIFCRQFSAPMPIMIWVAIIIELAIANYLDMFILLVIQFSNAFISFHETTKAGNAISALKSSLKPSATCKRDGRYEVLDATLLVPGDTVLLASGSAVPADCRVNDSSIEVDQSALTGESLPVSFYMGDSVKMGSTVVRGEVEATVEFTGVDTFFGKTATLLQETHERSHMQQLLSTIMYVLVGLSIVLCTINFFYLIGMGASVKEALSYTIVLLVASIPLAIEIVTTTTLAIGSKELVKHGAIVAKLAAIEVLAGMSILCSDKTGTLTLNQMVIQEDTPVYLEGETQESILAFAAMAAKWNEPPRDALDSLTLNAVNRALLEDFEQLDYVPFDPILKRTEGTVRNKKTGELFRTSKGAPHVILGLLPPSAQNFRDAVENDVARLGDKGIRSLAVARSKPDTGVWEMVGLLTFLDPPRPDTNETIELARSYGVQIKMITGDHVLIARNTAAQLELGSIIFTAERLPTLDPETKAKPHNLSKNYGDICLIADGFAQVYPEHKYLVVECLREMGYTVGMTGDGVNDAPALKRADVGIAVAGSTDAARAAADIVLTEPGLGSIVEGIVISREIFQRISNFITYRIAATLQLLMFFIIAIFAFHPSDYIEPTELEQGLPWPEFFHMPVLMLMLITLLNDGTLITIAYDYADASPTPNKWNLPVLFVVSSTLAAVSCASSLMLLDFLLDSWNPDGFFQRMGIGGVQYGQITTAIYLKVSVSDFLTLFSARTGRSFCCQVRPAPILLVGCIVALSLSSLLSIFWPDSKPDGVLTEGLQDDLHLFFFVWILCLISWLLQDLCKVIVYRFLYYVNFNNITAAGAVDLPHSAKMMLENLDHALAESGAPARKEAQGMISSSQMV